MKIIEVRESSFESKLKLKKQKDIIKTSVIEDRELRFKPIIQRQTTLDRLRAFLSENRNSALRQVLIQVAYYNPSILHEIKENLPYDNKHILNQIHRLISLGLVHRQIIFECYYSQTSYMEQKIKEKFERWSATMPIKLKKYFMGKGMYCMTDLGEKMLPWVCKVEGIECIEQEKNKGNLGLYLNGGKKNDTSNNENKG